MRFEITHHTRFRYSQPVSLEPLTVRLQPRCDFRQRLLSFSIAFDPAPAFQWRTTDIAGNDATCASFRDPLDALTVTTSFVAETKNVNPFDFVLHPDAVKLPILPAVFESPLFHPYRKPCSPCEELRERSRAFAQSVDFHTLKFVVGANEWIHAEHAKVVRPDGEPWTPEKTLREGEGSCRDLAVLLIEMCRAMGIPARFVSGYSAASEEDVEHLHAWTEVYLPGAGWRGYDPSLGLAITEQYLAVAAGPTHELAAPTTGAYRGAATSLLEAEIQFHASSAQYSA